MKSSNLKVDFCSYDAAKYACKKWHYSKCVPVGKLIKIGTWENGSFIGCIIYSRGATCNIGSPYGLNQNECCELTRVALNKHIAPVSQILGLSLKMLKRTNPGLQLIVSYADSGQGHYGGIYQATNWIYEGYFDGEVYVKFKGEIYHRRSVYSKFGTSSVNKIKGAKKVMAPGKHKYIMPLDKKTRRRVIKLSKSYPKLSAQT